MGFNTINKFDDQYFADAVGGIEVLAANFIENTDMTRILRNFIAFNLILFFVSGCGNLSKTDDKKSLKIKDSITTNNIEQEKNYSSVGFELMKNESFGEIRLELGINRVLEILGEPEEKTKAELWGADGEYHQQWNYLNNGIELDIIGEPDTALKVNMITISGHSELKTKRNIGIGSSFEDVKSAYKSEIDPNMIDIKTIVAGTIFGGIIFNFENNKVNSIFIGAIAE